jgi:hypothetical protein
MIRKRGFSPIVLLNINSTPYKRISTQLKHLYQKTRKYIPTDAVRTKKQKIHSKEIQFKRIIQINIVHASVSKTMKRMNKQKAPKNNEGME